MKNRFETLNTLDDIEDTWSNFKDAITESAKDTIPQKEFKANNKWMTSEILEMMDTRRKLKSDKTEYEKVNKEIKTKCKKPKRVGGMNSVKT